jgi:prophage regulatory protein
MKPVANPGAVAICATQPSLSFWEPEPERPAARPISSRTRDGPGCPATRLLDYGDLRDLYGIKFSRRWIYQLVRDGRFPTPLRLGDQSLRWRSDEIEFWIENLPRAVTAKAR